MGQVPQNTLRRPCVTITTLRPQGLVGDRPSARDTSFEASAILYSSRYLQKSRIQRSDEAGKSTKAQELPHSNCCFQ